MYIKRKTFQSRRDFHALMECEFCDATPVELKGGYDDSYYHLNVIPAMTCASCGHSGDEKASGPRTVPDVPAGLVM